MNPLTGLNVGRVVLGVVALLSPTSAARLLGLDPVAHPQMKYMSRMFGAREVALGALTLASSGQQQRDLVLTGIAVDATDTISGAAAALDGSVGKTRGVVLTLAALGALATGVVGREAARN